MCATTIVVVLVLVVVKFRKVFSYADDVPVVDCLRNRGQGLRNGEEVDIR
jgi:hypothetical protein